EFPVCQRPCSCNSAGYRSPASRDRPADRLPPAGGWNRDCDYGTEWRFSWLALAAFLAAEKIGGVWINIQPFHGGASQQHAEFHVFPVRQGDVDGPATLTQTYVGANHYTLFAVTTGIRHHAPLQYRTAAFHHLFQITLH